MAAVHVRVENGWRCNEKFSVVDASRILLQEVTQYFHSAYLLILQQLYRISSEIVGNYLPARTSALVWWCLEVGAEREGR